MDGLYRYTPFLSAGRSPWPINHTSDFINGFNSHRNCIIFPWPISQLYPNQISPSSTWYISLISIGPMVYSHCYPNNIGGAGLAQSVPRIDFFRKLEEKTATKRKTWKNMGHVSFLYPETCVIFLNSEKFWLWRMSKNWQPKMDNFGGKTHGDFHKRLEAAIEEELPSDVGGIKLHVRIVAQVGSSP